MRRLLDVLQNKGGGGSSWPPPIWMMRQAGRYLPEYRATRQDAGSFLDLCYSPKLATEVTLQPIRRFGFDAAILFSDILVIPDALGRSVEFIPGVGPRLDPITPEVIRTLEIDEVVQFLEPVFEAVSSIRSALPPETTLLGFCGAPWTVATYMVAGQGSSDQAQTRVFAHKHRDAFEHLIDRLTVASIDYLNAQIAAGADAVQVFDSWSGMLGDRDFQRFCIDPMVKIVSGVRNKNPDTPIIGFPKGSTIHYGRYVKQTAVDCVGLDWTYPISLAAKELSPHVVVQGNLDPTRLVAGGTALQEGVDDILNAMNGKPFVFNLGHGITPETPIAHVEEMVRKVREG